MAWVLLFLGGPPTPHPSPQAGWMYLIPWGRVFSGLGYAFDSAMVVAFYCVFKCVRCGSVMGGGYVFGSKVEVVNAFDSKILARATGDGRRKVSERRGRSESTEGRLAKRQPAGCAALSVSWGMAGLLSKIEKPAGMGRLFLFFHYEFSISDGRGVSRQNSLRV
jgi:hypothetical protein